MKTARADPRQRATFGETLKVDTASMIVRSVITTSAPDRAGDIIYPSGLKNAEIYMRNPVVLWAHQRTMPPIGTCEKLTIDGDRIIAETKFSASSTFASDLFRLYAEGVLRGWSIGFIPTRVEPNRGTYKAPAIGNIYSEWELLEYSAVPIPENPQALTLAVRKGFIQDADLRHWLIQDILSALHA
jgi:phage head maturation protease